MRTREEIVAQLADLREARASGMRTVKRGDREMQLQSGKELTAAIRAVEAELAQFDGRARRRRIFTTSTSKGL